MVQYLLDTVLESYQRSNLSSDVDSNLLGPDSPGRKLLIKIDRRPSVRASAWNVVYTPLQVLKKLKLVLQVLTSV